MIDEDKYELILLRLLDEELPTNLFMTDEK